MFPPYSYLRTQMPLVPPASKQEAARIKLLKARVRVLMEWSRGELEDAPYFWISRVIDAKLEALK